MKIAFLTDSGTGKTVAQLNKEGIYSVPLQVSYDHKNYQDLEDLGIDEVYQRMAEGKLLSTSLPSLGRMEELFTSLKAQGYDLVFAIPICAGLSGTLNAMQLSASQVGMAFTSFDCQCTGIIQDYLIHLAKKLYDKGKDVDQIKEVLEGIVEKTNTLLLPDDLQHLKRGGRLTPLAAALGGLLKIKPILEVNKKTNGKIDVVGKVRTMHKAMDNVIEIMKQEQVDDTYRIIVAHAENEKEAHVFMDKIKHVFPKATHQIIKLVSVVGVHTGKGCQTVQYFKMMSE